MHDTNLVRLFRRWGERNIKLTKSSSTSNVINYHSFIGHLPYKDEAIAGMDRPIDVQGVQRLISMVKYLSKFKSS